MKSILFIALLISQSAFAGAYSLELTPEQATSGNILAVTLIDTQVQKALSGSEISNISVAVEVKANVTTYTYSITNSNLNADVTGQYKGDLPDCTTTVVTKIQGGVAPTLTFSVESVEQACAVSSIF